VGITRNRLLIPVLILVILLITGTAKRDCQLGEEWVIQTWITVRLSGFDLK
jgi:hypothetical protein